MIETTIKVFDRDATGRAWLWPRSTDPEFQQPIPLDDKMADIEEVEVYAAVVGSYRPEVFD